MASKQVSEILVRLGIQGLQGLDKLKSSFRELEKAIGPSEQTIDRARQSIIEFGEAGNRSEQLIKGQIAALRGLQNQATQNGEVYKSLAADIKGLKSVAYGATSAVEAQRKALTEFGLSANATGLQIQQATSFLARLRGETRVDSEAFENFGKSIAALADRFKAVSQEAQNFANAQQRIVRPIGATSAAAKQQIRDLDLVTESLRRQRDELGALEGAARIRVGATALGQQGVPTAGRLGFEQAVAESLFGGDIRKLLSAKDIKAALDEVKREIANFQQEIETQLSRKIQISFQETARAGRESARAMAAAFSDPELINVFSQFDKRLGKLPSTITGLEQELSELTVQLSNVERGGSRYVEVSNRIAGIQKELQRELTGTAEAFKRLDIAQAGVERRSEKLTGIQEYYRTQGPLAPGVGGYRDPATGAMIMGGARTPGRIRVDEAAYATPIGPQPFPEMGRRAQESIERALGDVNRIYEDARIRRVEIQSKYDQIQIDKMLEGLDLEGRVRERGFRDELAAFDRQLEARDRKRRGRLTAGQAVQAAGAVISGGIFGGPEGFLGGVGGAVAGSLIPGLGTVGGAFAGAAIGAQVGAFRQQLGIAADYAAQLEKLRIALRNVTESSTEYNQALDIIRRYSEELAIPQDVITKSFTQLTASVIGAGGSVKDAEVAFRGIAAGIRGTGGSVENLNAAVTATAQVFSKGKVSAEELRGQIGERLPGAFSLFAESIGKTPQQLDKALEQGQVSLLDFQKFAEKLFEEYGESAKQIASGPEAAGDRLKTSLSNLSESVGTLLRPIGAEFQTVFAQIVSSIDAGVRKLNEFLGRGRQGEINEAQRNLDATERRIKQLQERIAERPGMGATRDFTVTLAQMQARRAQQFGRLQALLAADMTARGATGEAPERPGLPGATGETEKDKADKLAKEAAKKRKELFQELLARIQAQNNLLREQGRLNEIIGKDEQDRAVAALEAAKLELQNRQQQLDLRLKFGEISREVYDKEKTAITKQGEVVRAEFTKTAKDIEEKADKIYRDLFDPGGKLIPDDQTPLEKALRGVDVAINEAQKSLSELGGATAQKGLDAIKALTTETKLGLATRSLIGEDIETLENEIAALQSGANTMGTLGEIMQKHRQDWADLDAGQRKYIENLAAIKDGLRFAQDTRVGLGLREGAQQYVESIGTMRDATAQLAQTGIKGVEDAIFSLMTTGTANFREFAVSILQDTTRMIIQQLILRTIMQAIGAIGGGPKGGDSISQFISGANQYKMNANGNVYAQNGIQPFAMGGIVNKPTLFKYADGGAGRFGLMGEAGPEAIIPLKRGRDGKLGVAGGGSVAVTVNVDAQGTKVQGDNGQGQQLGRAVAAAVQAELIKQKRPGGLLA